MALLICLSLFLTPIVTLAAEGGSANDQDTSQTSELMEAGGALSAPSSDADEASFEDSADDTEEDADSEFLTDPEDSGDTVEEYLQDADDDADGSDTVDDADGDAESGDMIDGAADDADAGETVDDADDGEAANTGETDYEFSDPEEPEDAVPSDEGLEIIEDLGEIPSGENPALAVDVTNAVAPERVYVELAPADEVNNTPAIQIDLFKSQVTTGPSWNPKTTIVYQMYLPGSVDLSQCYLSWDGGAVVSYNGTDYVSGTLPVPPKSNSATSTGTQYTFTYANGNVKYNIVTFQGSKNVMPIFIDIVEDEEHTIALMDNDPNHNNTCSGKICINGTWYVLEQIKGRGNATWEHAQDKRPYNIKLNKKTDLKLDTPKTKKWSLLAEIADHSLLCNRTGFSISHKMGVGQDTASSDVWMNGEYQGCYTITPKYDSFVPDYGYLIEQDNYLEPSIAEGGNPQFPLKDLNEASGWTSAYNRITVKEMGDALVGGYEDAGYTSSEAMDKAVTDIQLKSWLQDFWDAVRSDSGYNSKGKYYKDYIDVESFAKVFLLHEYVKSYDICAGSLLFHRDGLSDDDKLIAGPMWDLDNSLGATFQNRDMGAADDRWNGDRRSGTGDFIMNVYEYKSSIYKNLGKHSDFMTEVKKQYNRYRSLFNELPSVVDSLSSEIEDSARMNHFKVSDLNHNEHKYDRNTTVQGQSYLGTTESKSDWGNYVANLKTFVSTRTQWFWDHYYDPSICIEHDFYEDTNASVPATCTNAGQIVRVCSKCQETETEEIPKLGHLPDEEKGVCSRENCGEPIPKATFEHPEGVTVTAYYTKDFSDDKCEKDAESAYCRDSETGDVVMNDDGQVNFLVSPKDGYELSKVRVTAAPQNYNKLKGPEDTGFENCWRFTKVTGSFTVAIKADVAAIVTFDADNGSDPSTQSVPISGTAQMPDDPVKEGGLSFEGWYAVDPETGDLADESFDFDTPITAPITLRAKWKAATLLRSAAVEFTGNIHLVFRYDFPEDVLADEGAYVSMKKAGKIVNIRVSNGQVTNKGTAFKLPVMIPEFADDVVVTVCDGGGNKLPVFGASSGENYTNGLTYSVKKYAEKKRENADTPEMKALAKALFDYGTAAQICFGYGDYQNLTVDEHVADEALNDAIGEYAFSADGTKPRGYDGASIMAYFQSDNTLRINFRLDDSRPASDFVFKLDGKKVDAETDEENNYIYVKNIPAPLLDKPHEFSISDAGSSYTIIASAMSYAYTSVENGTEARKNLGRAFYLYNQAANVYFNE